MQLYEVCIHIHIMWYIHLSKCQHNFLEKSVEAPPEQSPSVVLTVSVFIYILGRGGAQVENCIYLIIM